MKPLKKIELAKQITSELTSRMNSEEIYSYLDLSECNLVYEEYGNALDIKATLIKSDPRKLIEIADELKLEEYSAPSNTSSMWLPGYFRLFLSHVSSFKKTISTLQKDLKPYGISSFVAHEDIRPTSEWMSELEKALFSMDALAACLTDGFQKSSWCDHEVGIAIGRQVLIIPVKKETDPYGFISKIQALHTKEKNVSDVAFDIYNLIINNPKTRSKMLETLGNLLINSNSIDFAQKKIDLLEKESNINPDLIERIRIGAGNNSFILSNKEIKKRINAFLASNGSSKKIQEQDLTFDFDTDDIPF